MSLAHFLHAARLPSPFPHISSSRLIDPSLLLQLIYIQLHRTANYEGSKIKSSYMMEGGENKESKASVDDTESSTEQADGTDARARRFYECIFCKRGFSTAQALGGHMNIHRKDRAKMRPAAIPSDTEEPGEGSERCGSHYSIPSHHPGHPPFSDESPRNYAMYFPASASSNREVEVSGDEGDHSRRPQELSLFGEDLRSHGGDDEAVEDREERKMNGKEEKLDLELRLGHEPEARS